LIDCVFLSFPYPPPLSQIFLFLTGISLTFVGVFLISRGRASSKRAKDLEAQGDGSAESEALNAEEMVCVLHLFFSSKNFI